MARVQYDVEAVAESALDNIRALVDAVGSAEAEEFVARKALDADLPVGEVRAQLNRHADHCLERGRHELRDLAREAFEPLLREAIELIGEFMAAAAMDRIPDCFDSTTRREAREYAVAHAKVSPWLKVGRPNAQPPLPEEAANLVWCGAPTMAPRC